MTAVGVPVGSPGFFEHAHHVGHVVAVHLHDAPAEGLESCHQVTRFLRREPVARGVAAPAELLELVVVDDGDEVVGVVAGRDVGRLPDLALLALAVAEQHLGQEVLAQLPGTKRHAQARGEPHAQRAGRDVDARQLVHVGMTLQPRALLVEGVHLLELEVAGQRHGRVLAQGGVALGEDEAVTIGPVGLVGADAQEAAIQRGEDVGRRERTADMADLAFA